MPFSKKNEQKQFKSNFSTSFWNASPSPEGPPPQPKLNFSEIKKKWDLYISSLPTCPYCISREKKPKKIFTSKNDAINFSTKFTSLGLGNLEPYECRHGYGWHLYTKTS